MKPHIPTKGFDYESKSPSTSETGFIVTQETHWCNTISEIIQLTLLKRITIEIWVLRDELILAKELEISYLT